MTAKYAVITTVSTFRHRYAILLEPGETEESVKDLVTCDEVDEFSQQYVGEDIIDSATLEEDQLLELFDRDNDYLKGWTRDKKIQWINNLR